MRSKINNGSYEVLGCNFCAFDSTRIHQANKHAVAVRDGFPISPGHTLIIPRRHIVTLFEATAEELIALFSLLCESREQLIQERHPDGFNIGVNEGIAAGQTVMHLHINLIPRYGGHITDPRGGIRLIFPEKAKYWD
jgi:diadenosine tetraphosphate (Ap4A) HIT family hydrolase